MQDCNPIDRWHDRLNGHCNVLSRALPAVPRGKPKVVMMKVREMLWSPAGVEGHELAINETMREKMRSVAPSIDNQMAMTKMDEMSTVIEPPGTNALRNYKSDWLSRCSMV